MKRKILLLIAAFMGAAGIVLIFTGGILGIATGEGRGLIDRSFENMSIHLGDIQIGAGGIGLWEHNRTETENVAGGKQYENVEALSLDLAGMSVTMHPVPGNTVTVTADENIEDYVLAEWDGYELHLEKSDDYTSWGKFGKIDITVPEKQRFETVDISMDAGNLTADSLQTGYMELSMDGGSFSGIGKTSADQVEGNADAGDVSFEYLNTEYLDLSCDSGKFRAKLVGAREDYDLDLTSDLGSISCGDSRKDGIDNSLSELHDDAQRQLTVSADLGSIEIDFENQEGLR